MKVLILSNYNAFSLSLISRLSKENKQVFVITGKERKSQMKPKDVFQEYNFTYDNKNIGYIIENIDPEIIILGAGFDNLYELEKSPSKISDYLSSMANVAASLENPNLKRLIYLSSLKVFSANTNELIDEKTKAKPLGEAEKAVLMGENIFLNYNNERNFGVSLLRFGEIYGSYNDDFIENNICNKMCMASIKNQKIEITSKKEHLLIYIEDAVFALYKTIDLSKEDRIYHIGPSKENTYTEEDLLSLFKGNLRLEESNEEERAVSFDLGKLKASGFRLKHRPEDKIQELCKTIKKSENHKKTKERVSIVNRFFKSTDKFTGRLVPYFENFIIFILLNIFMYFTRNIEFHRIIDLYLLYVIVIAVIYGYQQTVFAIILSGFSKLYFSFILEAQALSLTSLGLYMWILQLFAIGVLVGYLKDKYELKYLDIKDKNLYLEKQIEDIKKINENNKTIKDLYEERLLNYRDSFGRIYQIVSELDLIEPEGIIFKAVKVIMDIMSSDDVSIYIYDSRSKFFRLAASSSEKASSFTNSFQASDQGLVFNKIASKEMFINTSLDPNYPMLAQGIYDGGRLKSIIMVWSLPFGSNNLYQTNIFGITCKLIEGSLNRASEYMTAIKKTSNFKYENVLDKESFAKILSVYEYGKAEGIVDYYIIDVEKAPNISQEDFIDLLRENSRNTDYIGIEDEKNMKILLTNTSKEDSEYVKERLVKNDSYIYIRN